MWHRVKDLSSEQRVVLEGLIGRRLQEDEGLNIQPAHILQESPTGDARVSAYGRYLEHLDKLAGRVNGISDTELETLIDGAGDHARHPHS